MDWYVAANYLLPLWQVCEGSHVVIIGNLHKQNLVLSESITLIRLSTTLGYNASGGIDNVVELPRFMALF
jgi:hypothetical protein